MGLPRSQFGNRWRASGCYLGFQRALGNGSRAASSCGLKVRLWRRAQFCPGQSDFIFADGAWDVCEGGHSLDVMNRWDALTMKIRCRRFGESRPSLRDRTGHPPAVFLLRPVNARYGFAFFDSFANHVSIHT